MSSGHDPVLIKSVVSSKSCVSSSDILDIANEYGARVIPYKAGAVRGDAQLLDGILIAIVASGISAAGAIISALLSRTNSKIKITINNTEINITADASKNEIIEKIPPGIKSINIDIK